MLRLDASGVSCSLVGYTLVTVSTEWSNDSDKAKGKLPQGSSSIGTPQIRASDPEKVRSSETGIL